MRMISVVVVIGAAALGCAGMAPAESDAVAISFEVRSVRALAGQPMRVDYRWSINAAGEATLAMPYEANSGMEARAFLLSPADFERVRAVLAPAERFVSPPIECSAVVAQIARSEATVSWRAPGGTGKAVILHSRCLTRDYACAYAMVQAADDVMRQATGTAERSYRYNLGGIGAGSGAGAYAGPAGCGAG